MLFVQTHKFFVPENYVQTGVLRKAFVSEGNA